LAVAQNGSIDTRSTTMNRHTIARTLFIAGLAFAPLSFAGADIVKCVDRDGRVTLTDASCQAGERSVTVIEGAEPVESPAAAPTIARTVRMTRARLPERVVLRDTLARLDPPSRSMARDVATLRAARQAMRLMDSAASSLRSQRLAGLH
jgi:hypothetical protein